MQLLKDQSPLTFFSDSQGEQQFLKTSQPLTTLKNTEIKDVYRENFQEEMLKMMKLAQTYNYISMDTQFPGVNIANQYVPWTTNDEAEHEYHVIKQNVDNSKIIQIGLTLSDEYGRVPQGICTWQFNFEFILGFDVIQKDSRQLLTNAGIVFERLKTNGIKLKDFAEYMVASGIVLNTRMKWIVFHGSYDFAYLLKMVHGDGLPQSTEQFYKLMRMYYPNIYDLKYYIKDIPNLKDVGLAKLGNEIGCSRIGPQHQAGSDSLLTLCCFFKLKEKKETDIILKNNNYLNIIYGIGKGYVKSNLNNSSNNYIDQRVWQNEQYMPMSHHQTYYYPQEVYYYYPQVYNIYDNNGNRM